MLRLIPLYRSFCPSCGSDASSSEIEEFGVCARCAAQAGRAESYDDLLRRELEDFAAFFKKAVGSEMWGGQRAWAIRMLNNESTAIIAPTGLGKTTLLLTYAAYASHYYKKRILYLAPTRSLVRQSAEKLRSLAASAGVELRVLFYDSRQARKAREAVVESVRRGDFDVFASTNSFFSKYGELLESSGVDVVLVDDVDSLLRSQANVKRLLRVIGYGEDAVELVKAKMSLAWKMMLARYFGNEGEYARLVEEYAQVERRLYDAISKAGRRQVVFASATGRMRGIYSKILRELLQIDISGVTVYGRDVTDAYVLTESCDEVLALVRRLGSGGVVLVSPRHPLKEAYEACAERLKRELAGNGLRVEEASPESIERFKRGDIDLLVGSANYYGVSVRGIDAPERIKYVVFLGTPLFAVRLDSYASSLRGMLRLILFLRDSGRGDAVSGALGTVRSLAFKLSPAEAGLVQRALSGKIPKDALSDKLRRVVDELEPIKKLVTSELAELLEERGALGIGTLTAYPGGLLLVPDVMTYIQATGRTSRLLGGKMTHGLSIVVESPQFSSLVRGLEERLKSIAEGCRLVSLSEVDLDGELKKIEESRAGGGGSIKFESAMVVVESPTKARAIAGFFGRPVKRKIGGIGVYEIPVVREGGVTHLIVTATRGHLYDLTTEPGVGVHGILFEGGRVSPVYSTIKRCRVCGAQFTHGDACPRCGSKIYTDSGEVVAALRKLVREVDSVYIATDPDAEGEKIAYDVYLALKFAGKPLYRIELHEITPREFSKAMANKREINRLLVEAEMYRRSLDRLVGFSLSQALQAKYGSRNLGAGRVQTPVLGFIVGRYREYKEGACWKVLFTAAGGRLKYSACFDSKQTAQEVARASALELAKVGSSLVEISPQPPFTTEQYLAAAAKMGLPSGLAMKVAQDLFESGLITYHRTDSTYVSSAGIAVALKYLEGRGWAGLARPSHWGEPGTHEAIRPVMPLDAEALERALAEGAVQVPRPLSGLHYRVYGLIFKRFVASQMRPMRAVVATYAVGAGGVPLGELRAIEGVMERGFDLVDPPPLPELSGDELRLPVEAASVLRSSRAPLYSEGDVVLMMKRHGIGRPSTYAKVIESLKRHGYVVLSKERMKLVPTRRGIEVHEFLSREFPDLVSVEATRRMEQTIDLIAGGAISAGDEVAKLYDDLVSRGLVRASATQEGVAEAL